MNANIIAHVLDLLAEKYIILRKGIQFCFPPKLIIGSCCRTTSWKIRGVSKVTGLFCALTFARPRLLAAEEAALVQLARQELWCLRRRGEALGAWPGPLGTSRSDVRWRYVKTMSSLE